MTGIFHNLRNFFFPVEKGQKLGTFLGVFTPSILTILGVILYLRIGWVVGSTGLMPALLIVVIANSITLATALSVSAIATNMFVGAGGAYYIISRSLGLQIGGAIGFPLFLAQTFSVTLYAFGFAESLRILWPEIPLQPVAALTVLLVSFISGRGAGLALKLQIPIMILVVLSLLSLAGGLTGPVELKTGFFQGVPGSPSFWYVFAVFFPAVTGIMAGVSLSGDLKNPTRSIPRGALAAVLTGFIVYLIVPIILAVSADSTSLVKDPLIWMKVSAVPFLILPGLWGAILSSAIGSILGAPRTLEALADDGVLPHIIGKNSRFGGIGMAHIVSSVAALIGVAMGDLNAVAPVLTMFFLTTYGMVNLVAGLEQLSGAPSYRPTVRIPWIISLAGAAGCFWVMFLISSTACLIAILSEVGIYFILRKRALTASWGDLRHGAMISLARSTLLQLRRLPSAPRNWRPHILVFAGDINRRIDLVRFAAWLNQGRGILTVSRLIVGELEELASSIPDEMERTQQRLEEAGLTAFPEVEVVSSFEEGVISTIQAHGIAGISSNTIMFGWSEKRERLISHLRILRKASLLGKSTVICRIRPKEWSPRARRIDVWWGGLQNNGDMLLLFAYLLTVNAEWRSARIHVRSLASTAMMKEQTERTLKRMLKASRIEATVEVTQIREGDSVQAMIHRHSRDADVVFMGLREPGHDEVANYADRLINLVGDLPTVLLVRNASPFAGHLLGEPNTQES
ncbi:MAG TPA: Na-K-Cl cotransporter [Thermoanaerobaculia bacterium]|nr:Na-K-Cl cotransporter [Thermoanaerobaculia bacterium]HUM28851.1 Na-K-Cl cotransporter [Thermoanaerobaculia bacterium]HXK67215.1 Na-K-Cl cotransporter [Thermoanaerobaculia bacterium]